MDTAEKREQQAAPTVEPSDLIAVLESLPDLRPALESYSEEELADLFAAFDLEARYNHVEKTLQLSVTVFPELAELLKRNGRSRRPVAASR